MTPTERKEKVKELKKEHEKFFKAYPDALYIPKMAYRPSGKDELHISFFPSELEKGKDIYTEFVSIEYDSEDPLRTLYMHKHNPHWKEEYELVTSNSGFERHLIPVSELNIINDINSRSEQDKVKDPFFLPNPDKVKDVDLKDIFTRIAVALEDIANKLNK